MTYQERQHVQAVLSQYTAGYNTECSDGLRIKDELVLGLGYTECVTVEEVVKIYPHLAKELTHGN